MMAAAALLAAASSSEGAELYDRMRERFLVYPPICSGQVECVLDRMKSWFGRSFEAHMFSGKACVYLVKRDASGALVEFVLVGEM